MRIHPLKEVFAFAHNEPTVKLRYHAMRAALREERPVLRPLIVLNYIGEENFRAATFPFRITGRGVVRLFRKPAKIGQEIKADCVGPT